MSTIAELKIAAAELASYTETMVKQVLEWNAAVERVIGQRPQTGINTCQPQLALSNVRYILKHLETEPSKRK